MKKLSKLAVRKVTLRDLDEPVLNKVAAGAPTDKCTRTCVSNCEMCTLIAQKERD